MAICQTFTPRKGFLQAWSNRSSVYHCNVHILKSSLRLSKWRGLYIHLLALGGIGCDIRCSSWYGEASFCQFYEVLLNVTSHLQRWGRGREGGKQGGREGGMEANYDLLPLAKPVALFLFQVLSLSFHIVSFQQALEGNSSTVPLIASEIHKHNDDVMAKPSH